MELEVIWALGKTEQDRWICDVGGVSDYSLQHCGQGKPHWQVRCRQGLVEEVREWTRGYWGNRGVGKVQTQVPARVKTLMTEDA